MSNKLQNIKAVKEMLAGEHKFQKRKTTYFGSTTTEIDPKDILEKFDDDTPKVWIETKTNGTRIRVTKHDGFTSREPENSITKQIRDILEVPDNCPQCGTDMREKEKMLNFKFYFKRQKCFSCVLSEEEKIKTQGEDAWKEYENKIMLANAESWFKDADKEVDVLKKQIVRTWQNADGEYGEADMSSFLEKMEEDYKKLKTNIRTGFK
tara:strand:+ start:171 stop:794 length:624 start_codon:yes stop_codon:yes gene_type:complete